MSSERNPRVLSVQSSTVFSNVGNSAAVFPLQYRGCVVSPIHTLQFSSEPLYSCGFAGSKIPDGDIEQILDKMTLLCNEYREKQQQQNQKEGEEKEENPLFENILSGYIGTSNQINSLAKFVSGERQKEEEGSGKQNKKSGGRRLFFLADPVVGDHGRLYVAKEVAEAIREKLLPLADAITPNFFEAGFFSGVGEIDSHQKAKEAAKKLHSFGPQIVVITSYNCLDDDDDDDDENSSASKEKLNKKHKQRGYVLLSHLLEEKEPKQEIFSFPYLDGRFVGCGDIISSLLLSQIALQCPKSYHQTEEKEREKIVSDAVFRSVSILFKLCLDTSRYATELGGQKELRVIHNRKLFDLEGNNTPFEPEEENEKELCVQRTSF